jgi:hypothetical protein
MNKSVRLISVVEMTRAEYHATWGNRNAYKELGIVDWNTDDGNNDIRFKGEDFYRPVCFVEED